MIGRLLYLEGVVLQAANAALATHGLKYQEYGVPFERGRHLAARLRQGRLSGLLAKTMAGQEASDA